MIENHVSPGKGTGYLLVVPHASMTWQDNKVVIAVVGLMLAGTGTVAALNGLWLILPFAGAELLGLSLVLYLTQLGQQQREVIAFTESEVVVQRGRHSPDEEIRLPRHWSHFVVGTSADPWRPPRLALRYRDREIELARRLGAQEKDQLIAHLRAITANFTPRT